MLVLGTQRKHLSHISHITGFFQKMVTCLVLSQPCEFTQFCYAHYAHAYKTYTGYYIYEVLYGDKSNDRAACLSPCRTVFMCTAARTFWCVLSNYYWWNFNISVYNIEICAIKFRSLLGHIRCLDRSFHMGLMRVYTSHISNCVFLMLRDKIIANKF